MEAHSGIDKVWCGENNKAWLNCKRPCCTMSPGGFRFFPEKVQVVDYVVAKIRWKLQPVIELVSASEGMAAFFFGQSTSKKILHPVLNKLR